MCVAARAQSLNPTRTGRRVSASTFASCHAAPGERPRFVSPQALRRVATQVAASMSKYRAASYDLGAPAERRWWLASVGIGLGLPRSSILRCCAVYYPRGSTSVATSLRSPRPLPQCQNLPASTEPHFLTIAIRSRALPHSWASRPLKKSRQRRPSCNKVLGRLHGMRGGPATEPMPAPRELG